LTDFHLNIIQLEKVGSTNKYAANLLKDKKVAEGTVIWALEQSEGKGQGDNRWESEPGKNLTFTMVLHPVFLGPEKQFFLNQAISLGILDYTGSLITAETNSLKWPNDIYAGNRKLGGILINNFISGNHFETSIAGIGLNINQTEFSPKIPNPVSLKMILKKETELRSALISIWKAIESRYRELMNREFQKLTADYCNKLLGYSEWRRYLSGERDFKGKITGVTESGRLVVQDEQLKNHEFDHGKIEYCF
jgi:BirA family transcriptional regulator, biotin operon repressor / biotin---[acetyl-CoA-carboxylase] ligase